MEDVSCLKWLCGIESKEGVYRCGAEYGQQAPLCGNLNCNSRTFPPKYGDECHCGVYQIGQQYWADCHDPANGYTVSIPDHSACSANEGCATECVHNYIKVRQLSQSS